MATIQSIWMPRRARKSVMAGSKKDRILMQGEFFVEAPDTGVGTGHSKAKVGDGHSTYENLPYAFGDTENEKITFTANTSTTVAAALTAVVSGATLKNIIAGLKQAIVCNDANVTLLKDELVKKIAEDIENMKKSFQAGCDKIVGKLTALGYEPEAPQGPDEINNAIDKMYTDRYSAGLAANPSTSGTTKIKYTYHKHTGSETAGGGCYTDGYHVHTSSCTYTTSTTPCTNPDVYIYDSNPPASLAPQGGVAYRCRNCTWSGAGNFPGNGFPHFKYVTNYTCGSPVNRYRLGCGMNVGQIEKAEITFV